MLDLTQANYNLAIRMLQNLLNAPSKLGSATDVEIFKWAHFIEDYEITRRAESNSFEPYIYETSK